MILSLFLFVGNSFSGEIVKYPLAIQADQLIFNSPEINYHLKRHQQDALYVPYKIRQLIYSDLVFIYALLINFFSFLNLKNLFDILLIANFYPIFISFRKILNPNFKFKYLFSAIFLITIFTSGIDRSPDKFQSLYLLGPVFIYLIILGMNEINKKFYLALWIFSFYIFVSPKI